MQESKVDHTNVPSIVVNVMEAGYTDSLDTEKYLSLVLGKHSEMASVLCSTKDCVKLQ